MTATRHILRQKEPGRFPRSRRERLVPSEALLARHPRRHTPGRLRRLIDSFRARRETREDA